MPRDPLLERRRCRALPSSRLPPPVPETLRPRGRRESIDLPATAKLCRERELPVNLFNISFGGFAAEADEDVPIGGQIVLVVDGVGDLPALVRWALGGKFGASFNGRMGRPEKELIAALVRMRL